MYKYTSNDDYIISIEEQEEIVEWLRNNYLRLKHNDPFKYVKSIYDIPDIPKVVWDIRKRIVEKENLENSIPNIYIRDCIGYMIHGGQLEKHIDDIDNDLDKNLIHTRFNVYVQLPIKGGYPVYANKLLKLKERTYICCRAGIDEHYCEKVEGERERIVLSYGFLLPYDRIKNIIYEYDD